MLEQVQEIPQVLIHLCLSGLLCMTFVMGGISVVAPSTRPPDLPLEKPICRSGSNRYHWTWNNRLVPNREGVHQGCILSPCLFNLYAEYIMRNPGLDEAQDGIKIAGRNINSLRYANGTTLMAKS